MYWKKCESEVPPKDRQFLLSWYGKIGIGCWGPTYKMTGPGHSQYWEHKYIIVLRAEEMARYSNDEAIEWDENDIVSNEAYWMDIPKGPII